MARLAHVGAVVPAMKLVRVADAVLNPLTVPDVGLELLKVREAVFE